jgi:hypothetical protein
VPGGNFGVKNEALAAEKTNTGFVKSQKAFRLCARTSPKN